MGMVVNYYYELPSTTLPTAFGIFNAIATSPIIITHGVFGVLSTGMSIPIFPAMRKLGLKRSSWLHVGAFSVRLAGFVGGILFLYFSTPGIDQEISGNIASFVMASVFMTAVTLTFLSRIFIYRKDAEVENEAAKALKIKTEPPEKKLGGLKLPHLQTILDLSYANFVVYLLLYFSGMYVNIWITSGVNTINISNGYNVFHMIVTTINFGFSFFIMAIAFIYGLRNTAIFSLGAIISIIVSSLGGLVFLVTGGGRTTGSLTLAGGWIMSMIFMLAFFLSYYAALEIVKAISAINIYREMKK
jgi:MFS family permease